MDKFVAFFKTSEGWLLVLGAVLGVLVSAGVLPNGMDKFILDIIAGLIAVITQRGVHKALNGGVVFQPLNKGV